MVKVKSLNDVSSEKLNGIFGGGDGAPTEVKEINTPEELKINFRKDVIYSIPAEWFDIEDKTFSTRSKKIQEHIDSMKESIKSQGQQEPVKARLKDGNKLQIVMGWTRVFACLELGFKVQTMVTDADERTCKVWALIENIQRNELEGYDKARKVKELLDDNFTVEEVSQFIGVSSKSYVYTLNRIFNYPVILNALKDSVINETAARVLSTTVSSKNIPEDLQKKAIEYLSAEKLKIADLEYFLDRGGELPGVSAASPENPDLKTPSKGKKKGSSDDSGIKSYFKKFNDGKISFSARAVPGKSDIKELKKIRTEALKFVESLEKIISKNGSK